MYLLGEVDIWRYPGLDDGVANRGRWLKPGVEPNLSDAVDWDIDGEIWVLGESGKVLRFNQGGQLSFEIKGLVEPLGEPRQIAINSEKQELVILDRANGTLVIVSQESGEYRRRLVWERLKQADDVVVDPSGKRVFVVIDSELFELEL